MERCKCIQVYEKDSPSKPENYRLISLLSCLRKIMVRCIHKYLFIYLKLNNIISTYQSSFQSGDSTINHSVYLYNKFLKALDGGKEIRLVFCDISKAFDMVWHKRLIFKLKYIGVSGDMLQFFTNCLSNRRQCVCIRGCISLWLPVLLRDLF